ncbi:MAG: Rne/Rng family ribonuclease [Candidatus Adiutrix sp.]|nr:Rne/Rng family ribonuclease [Candidatus Adiutrix sp.]
MDKILINAIDAEECRVAMLDAEGHLQEYYTDSSLRELSLGNIYKGVIQNIEPSLQAAFVNYGNDRNGFLQVGDIHPEYFLEEPVSRYSPDLKKALKKGQPLLVQVLKEPSEIKGAALTTFISLAGRFIVLTPGRDHVGVSRKIENDKERSRLRKIADELPVPEGCGYIVRTVAEGRIKEELAADLQQVFTLWEDIRRQGIDAPAPSLIYREQDLAVKILRDHLTSSVREILVDDAATYHKVLDYVSVIAPAQRKVVKFHKEKRPIFARHQLEEQLETIYHSRVKLKGGGSIVITPTEALVSIDVNSGRGAKDGNLEDTALNTNLEAAEEVARQLRLRDLGGLVVVDFIDMREEKHRREVEKRIQEAARNDKAKTDFGHISKFGLLELSRQRLRPSIEMGNFITCQVCEGRGLVKTPENASLGVLRQISHAMAKGGLECVNVLLNHDVAHYLLNHKRAELARLEARHNTMVVIKGQDGCPPGSWEVEQVKRGAENDELKPGQVMNNGQETGAGNGADNGRPPARESGPGGRKRGSRNGGQASASATGALKNAFDEAPADPTVHDEPESDRGGYEEISA